jgi:uncharacterized protein
VVLKDIHEIRDPIHVFVRLDSDERRVLDSRPFQRLRHIHQLALSYLVYPGATHRRFEHSLGVMELAGRVFDVVTRPENITDEIRTLLPEVAIPRNIEYARRILRMAALCHDLGHLPFSHAAEKELLPDGWDHEAITRQVILDDEMQDIWRKVHLDAEDIVKLAIGHQKAKDLTFTRWHEILSEIIVGDAFGVDRMDYLLRDSHHTGVAYGRFDHYRLIDTLRILCAPSTGEPALGVEEGGLHSSEALLLARYFMYSQVYFHPIRRIYDIHLKDFLGSWLPGGRFPIRVEDHLRITDNEVTSALITAASDPTKPGHDPAMRIISRQHFRVLYQRHPDDIARNPDAGVAVFEAAQRQFGSENVRYDKYTQGGGAPDFPVLANDGRVNSSISRSEVIEKLPVVAIDYVFIVPERRSEAEKWLRDNRTGIIQPQQEEDK